MMLPKFVMNRAIEANLFRQRTDFLLLPAPLDFQTFLRPRGTLCSRMCSWLSKPTFCGLVFVVLRNWPISSPIIIICYQHQLLQGRPYLRCYSELFKFFSDFTWQTELCLFIDYFSYMYLPWKERNQYKLKIDLFSNELHN